MRRALSLIALLPVVLTACSLNNRPTLSPTKMAEFWQEPADLGQRNLLHGPGGAALAPNPNDRYVLLEVDATGFSPGYEVRDETGRKWSVKLGPESRTEVVVSRIVSAMVTGNRVHFRFQGAWREPQLVGSITPYDVRWMCERLARLTPDQWRDAFRAGGYTDAEAGRFIRRIRQKIDEGLQLDRNFPLSDRTVEAPTDATSAAR